MKRAAFFLAMAALLPLAPVASAQSGDIASTALDASYTLPWWTADGGGAFTEGGSYTMGSTVGQPDAGIPEGSGYALTGGFWGGAAAGPVTYRVYMPLLATGAEEREPNGVPALANGPVASNQTHYGAMPAGDTNDYFYFDLPSTGSAELWLTNIPAGCDYDLVLRDAALDQIGYSGNTGSTGEYVTAGGLSPGRYYVQVYHRSAVGSTQPYQLRAVYP